MVFVFEHVSTGLPFGKVLFDKNKTVAVRRPRCSRGSHKTTSSYNTGRAGLERPSENIRERGSSYVPGEHVDPGWPSLLVAFLVVTV